MLGKSPHRVCKEILCFRNLLEFFEGVNKHVSREEPSQLSKLGFSKALGKVSQKDQRSFQS